MSVSIDLALLLFKLQSAVDTPATPDPTVDALLIGQPDFATDIQQIERDVVGASLSPQPTRNGRIEASVSFPYDVIGAGVTDGSTAPAYDALLRACGMARTSITTPGLIQSHARSGNTGSTTFAQSGSGYTLDIVRYVTLECTVAGGSGTAQFTVTAPATVDNTNSAVAAVNLAAAVMTDATAFAVGHGAEVTPTFVSNAAVGDKYVLQLGPEGHLYTPVSSNFEVGSCWLYFDGIRHVSNNMRGSFSLEAAAGNIAQFTFNMQGDFAAPTDQSIPTNAVYSDLIPPQVELADLRLDNASVACPANFGFDFANEVVARDCVNAVQGYAGSAIVDRNPTITFDPEFGPEADYAYWAKLQSAEELDFSATIGTVRGNMVHILSHAQISNLTYGDRNRTRIYNVEGRAVSRAGNDELSLYVF